MTPRQRETLRVIARHIAARGYPPTLREIGNALGIVSLNGVNDKLRRLVALGFIERDTKTARGLRLTRAGSRELGEKGVES